MPSGGTPQALQSGVDAPAMEAKLPWTSRVLPNPMTGDPLAVLDTVWINSWLRRSLLCACSSRSEINVPSGLETSSSTPTAMTITDANRAITRPRDTCSTTKKITPTRRDTQSPRLSEYTTGSAASRTMGTAAICCQRRPCRNQPTRKNGKRDREVGAPGIRKRERRLRSGFGPTEHHLHVGHLWVDERLDEAVAADAGGQDHIEERVQHQGRSEHTQHATGHGEHEKPADEIAHPREWDRLAARVREPQQHDRASEVTSTCDRRRSSGVTARLPGTAPGASTQRVKTPRATQVRKRSHQPNPPGTTNCRRRQS